MLRWAPELTVTNSKGRECSGTSLAGKWLSPTGPCSRYWMPRPSCLPHSSNSFPRRQHLGTWSSQLHLQHEQQPQQRTKGDERTRWVLPVRQSRQCKGVRKQGDGETAWVFCGVRSRLCIMRKLPSQIKTVWSGGARL